MELKNTKTLENLARAFIAETTDGAKYQFLKTMAEGEKHAFVADTLQLLSTNEMAHAKVWWDLITTQNSVSFPNIEVSCGFPFVAGDLIAQLGAVKENEKMQGEHLYLDFAKTAKEEKLPIIAKFFEMAAEVERQHSMIITQLYDGLKKKSLYKNATAGSWKCSACGHETKSKSAFDFCEFCGSPQGYAMPNIKMTIIA